MQAHWYQFRRQVFDRLTQSTNRLQDSWNRLPDDCEMISIFGKTTYSVMQNNYPYKYVALLLKLTIEYKQQYNPILEYIYCEVGTQYESNVELILFMFFLLKLSETFLIDHFPNVLFNCMCILRYLHDCACYFVVPVISSPGVFPPKAWCVPT